MEVREMEAKEQEARRALLPDETWSYIVRPTRWTLFLRTFLPWQAWRFAVINWKMLKLIFRSHSGR
jgi:hypothetical protein